MSFLKLSCPVFLEEYGTVERNEGVDKMNDVSHF